MGIIILLQSEYLKFNLKSKTNSVLTCFIVAVIELVILLLLLLYERYQNK
jgi:hypothetical protein